MKRKNWSVAALLASVSLLASVGVAQEAENNGINGGYSAACTARKALVPRYYKRLSAREGL